MASWAISLPSPKIPNFALPLNTSRLPIKLACLLAAAERLLVRDGRVVVDGDPGRSMAVEEVCRAIARWSFSAIERSASANSGRRMTTTPVIWPWQAACT